MSDSNSTERDDAHAADNVTSPNRNSLTEHTTTINPNSHTTVTQHSDSYSSSLRGYVYVSPENVRGSSLRTDTTTSDLITRPSIDSVDDDEDNRVEVMLISISLEICDVRRETVLKSLTSVQNYSLFLGA